MAGLSVDETIAIWISYDDYRSRANFTLSARALRGINRSELDVQAVTRRLIAVRDPATDHVQLH